jgi:hypothetical protein
VTRRRSSVKPGSLSIEERPSGATVSRLPDLARVSLRNPCSHPLRPELVRETLVAVLTCPMTSPCRGRTEWFALVLVLSVNGAGATDRARCPECGEIGYVRGYL